MRLVSSIFAVLVLSTLSGCAATSVVTPIHDTAVRAEPRRVSEADFADPIREHNVPVARPTSL
jgi:hypothetical protein